MAHYDCQLTGSVEDLVAHLDEEILRGSKPMFFKMDTVGEGTFLDKAVAALQSFPQP